MKRNGSRQSYSGPTKATASLLADGMTEHQAGRLDAAERCYRAIRRRNPDYAEAQRLLGIIAQQQGRPDAAIKLLRRAIAHQPANPIYHHSLAEVLRVDDQLDDAITAYRRAFALQPERLETGIELGDTLARAGYGEQAIEVYRRLIDARPNLADAHTRLANLLYERGDPEAAAAQLERWQACASADAATHHALAAAHTAVGAYAQAVGIYRAALASFPDDGALCAGLGSVLQSQGEFDEATRWLEQALALDPGLGWVYAALMSNRRYPMSPARVATMQRQAESTATGADVRSHLCFALGQYHDGRGETAAAFAHFQAGNQRHARCEPFDPVAFDDRIERIIRCFDAVFFAERRDLGHASERPLFIVGMPRSGTSLVEQIIASHPQASGAGELADAARMVRELPALIGARQRYPECMTQLEGDTAAVLAERYLGALSARSSTALRVTDKMPFNMLWLGLLGVLFPNARVVYCRREPMDNCLSCYFQLFSQGLRFSYDLAHLGHVYRQHERLMAHWAQCLPMPMLTLNYEALVDDQEAEIRRLIEFTGLPWDDACLDFHRAERDVRTASVWQVRQPVYRSSIARWRVYEPWLGDLRTSLEQTPHV